MYFEKLRIPPQNLWRVLTLSAILLLVYQHGPGWIHHIHRYNVSQQQVDYWVMHCEIHSSAPEAYAKTYAFCQAWLSAHGVEIPGANPMKDSYQKWSEIFAYWQGLKV